MKQDSKVSRCLISICHAKINKIVFYTERCFYNEVFNLEKGANQGDPISAYLLILVLEIIFLLIKKDSSIKGIKTVDYVFLYKAYANDSTFKFKNLASVKKLLDVFYYWK